MKKSKMKKSIDIYKNLISFLFGTLLFLLPLIFSKSTSELFEFNKIILLYFSTLTITTLWLLRSIKQKKLILSRTIFDIPILLLLGANILSTVFSIDTRTSIFGYYGRFNGGLTSQICHSLLFFAFVSNIDKSSIKKYLWVVVSSLLISGVISILEHFGFFATCGLMGFGFFDSCWVQDVKTRVFSTFGQPNWLAAGIVAVIPFIQYLFLNIKDKNKRIDNTLIFVGIAIFLILGLSLIFTGSRSGILAFFVSEALFLTGLIIKKNNYILKYTVFLVTIFTFMFLTIQFKLGSNQHETESINSVAGPSLETGGTESSVIRKYVWQGALNVFLKNPILGTGVETFAYSFPRYKPVEHNLTSEWDFIYNKAHNEFLNYLANTGIVGFGLYMTFVSTTLIVLIKTYHKEDNLLYLSLLSSFISILTTNFFGFSVVFVSTLFYLIPAFYEVEKKQSQNNYRSFQIKKVFSDSLVVITLILFGLTFLKIINYYQADVFYNKAQAAGSDKLDYINKAIEKSPKEPIYTAFKASITKNLDLSETAYNLSPLNQNIRKVFISNLIEATNNKVNYYPQAEDLILKSIEYSENDPKLYYQLGLIQLKLGKDELGLKSLNKAVELKSNYKDARFALGKSYQAIKKYDLAKSEYEYILKNIDSKDELTQKSLKEINSD